MLNITFEVALSIFSSKMKSTEIKMKSNCSGNEEAYLYFTLSRVSAHGFKSTCFVISNFVPYTFK